MKKKRLLSIVLAVSLSCSSLLTSCESSGFYEYYKNVLYWFKGGSSSENQKTVETEERKTLGTHVYTASETSVDLVKNGVSEYMVVIPAGSTSLEKKASEEFIYLFEKATGVKLVGISEPEGATHDASAKYISIGETNMLKSSGVSYDKSVLGSDGGRIVTKDNSIYIVGGSDYGSLFAVYTFMELTFNFDQFSVNCYRIDENQTNVKLMNYDVTDIPDVRYRVEGLDTFVTSGLDYDGTNATWRMKLGRKRTEMIMPIHKNGNMEVGGSAWHNSFKYLPKDIWMDEELPAELWPEDMQESTETPTYGDYVYAASELQLCYTAHGNEKVFEWMAQECARVMEQSLMKYNPTDYPEMDTVTLTVQDGGGFCECSNCTELKIKYSTTVGSVLIFVNRVAEIVEEWMAQEENKAYVRNDLKILFFAYNSQTIAPTKWNDETGRYEPIDEDVVMHPLTGVLYAENSNAKYRSAFTADDTNSLVYKNMQAWGDMTENYFLWTYSTNFDDYLYPSDTFGFYNGTFYQHLYNCGVDYLFDQNQTYQKGTTTAWHNLKQYLESKLLWNSSLDENELIDKWFQGTFGEAADVMREVFDSERAWIQYVKKLYNTTDLNNRTRMPYATLKQWRSSCEEALKIVEKYKVSDPDYYQELCDNIDGEWVSFAYMTIELWDNGTIPSEERAELVAKLKSTVKRLGMTCIAEHSKTFQSWAESLK